MNLLIRLSTFTLLLFISVSSKNHQIDFFAKLYSKPDTNAPIIKVLNDGITVEIIEEKDQWLYVVYEDTYGWLKNTSTPIQSEKSSISHSFLAILSAVLIFTILIITYRKKKPLPNNPQEKEVKSSSKTIEFKPRSSSNKVLIFSKSDKNVKSQISGLYKRMSKCFEGIGFQIDFIEKINAGALTEHENVKVIAVDYELHSNVIKKIESNIQQFGETNSKALILFYNIPKPENIPPSKTLDHAYYLGTSFSEEELFKIMAEGNIILNSEKSEPFLQGKISDDSLLEIFQLQELSGKDGVLKIMNSAKGVVGLIGFKNGSITYARTQKENGENAIFKILSIQKGFFALENKSPSKNNINIRPVEVLMRYLKANDETKKNSFPKSVQILSLFLMFFVVGCNKEENIALPENESDIKLRIHGSNTIGAHLMPTMVNAWLENLGATDISIDTLTNQVEKIISGDIDGNPIKVEIFSYGSSTGFSDLAWKKADLAMSSKEINGSNIEKLSPLGDMTKPDCEHVLALDGIAIVTHPSNKIKTLNLSQLRKIYSGEIRNWNQIHPEQSGLIKLFRRDEHSGTHEMFKQMVMKKTAINDESKISLDNDTMIKEINLHSNSIGYISSTYAKDVKILSVQSDNVRSYQPTSASIQTEEYPLSRRLYLYSPERSLNKYLNSFLEFSLSTPGQKVVQSSGFIPQIIRLIKPEIEDSFSQQYIDIIQNAMRINMNFRFNKTGTEIDNRSVKDLNRLSQFIKKEKLGFCKFRLIGFSDDSQDIRESNRQSLKRASSIARMIESSFGAQVESVHGLGSQMPIASNKSISGRSKNQRIEVWIRCPDLTQ